MVIPTPKLLLVTETPPGTPNGFGVTLNCMFKEIPHQVVYTDSIFKDFGDNRGFLHAQVPYHPARKFFLPFLCGKIPEWRGSYSSLWLKKKIPQDFSSIYAFVYSTQCMDYAYWLSKKKKVSLFVHLADHSKAFEETAATKILMGASRLICITEEMKSKYEQMLGRNDIEVLHNGAEQSCREIPPPFPGPFGKENPFVICFIGGLFSHLHGNCIEDIFEAVSIIRKERPCIEFHLFGQRQPETFLDNLINTEGCQHHGIIMPLDKKLEIMQMANCFVIPSSFNPESHKDYRYSFPTKLPELLASGRPIISYGPQDTSTNHILSADHIGIRIHKRSIGRLVDEIKDLEKNYQNTIQNLTPKDSTLIEKYSAKNVRSKLSKILKLN